MSEDSYPLHAAAEAQDLSAISQLLGAGHLLTDTNNKLELPFDVAPGNFHYQMSQLAMTINQSRQNDSLRARHLKKLPSGMILD